MPSFKRAAQCGLMTIVLSILGIHAAYATDIQVNPQAMLHSHNQVRNSVGVAPLSWSPRLAEYAQQWAQHLAQNNACTMEHRQHGISNPLQAGENLYWHGALKYSSGKKSVVKVSDADVVNEWASEKAFYSYHHNTCQAGEQCGHYTQIVWHNTQKVGCGAAMCADKGQIWVCSYDPAGNWHGEKPY